MAATLIGLICLMPCAAALKKKYGSLFFCLVSSFGAGALLASAAYLMLFEGVHLVGTSDESESAQSFKYGTMILLGFIMPSVITVITGLVGVALDKIYPAHPSANATDAKVIAMPTGQGVPGDVEMIENGAVASKASDEVVTAKATEVNSVRRHRVLSSVLLGDFLHNIVDGLFIGAAFTQCDSATGWVVATGALIHELAQELSDYFVLTDPMQGALQPRTALFLNFLAGSSCPIGCAIALSIDEMDETAMGMILAYAAGTYIEIGATECMNRVHEEARNLTYQVLAIFMFVFGAVCIGLVLLDHQHCSAAGGGHDGHGH